MLLGKLKCYNNSYALNSSMKSPNNNKPPHPVCYHTSVFSSQKQNKCETAAVAPTSVATHLEGK